MVAVRDTVWRLIVSTVGTCLRNRVTGLAAEAAFFALLSLPPLIFGARRLDRLRLRAASADRAVERGPARRCSSSRSQALTAADRRQDHRADAQRRASGAAGYDVISIGFVLALWSGSRALNVFVDTITIMYGLGGHRGIVKTRMLSFSLYVLGLVTGVVTIPLVVAGPRLVDRVLPERLDFAQRALLADRRGAVHLLPRHALPRVRAGADVVALQPARAPR